ncbi:MAG: SPOR domain-containing protein [Halioglobus sp.]
MYIRQGLLAGVFVLSLTACGMFSEKFGADNDSPTENGREEVTDDWSCESNDSGEWDCYQASPDEDASARSEEAPTLVEPAGVVATSAMDSKPTVVAPTVEEATVAAGVSIEPSQGDEAAYLQDNYDWQQLSSDAYVLQLAAHTSRENAQLALTTLDAPDAKIVKTWSDDGDVYVIIAGSYPDKPTAEAAANVYLESNADATYWIRSTANFLKAI